MTTSSAASRWRAGPAGATAVTAALLLAALVTWVVTAERMRGMDAGPGTDLGGLGWFLGVWVTMMAAMMLPSAVPMVTVVHRVSAERPGRTAAPEGATAAFVAGYLAAWTAYGLVAYGLVPGRRGPSTPASWPGTARARSSRGRPSPLPACTSSPRSSGRACAAAARRCTG